ncbi:hypothetical protein EG344_16360 [Chryseobacterium sp. G0162]|uniref:lipid II flippase MurJ n=1 Tax=Chryseobacterium sp. G0162 TaxID=2487063 RepID=UPI000F4DED40|nr:lipid II flippase MurJ [Chryseobacterium sp. G0162]AZB10280.1 hypothetical protein EG344_16360 [Chryseobacterium sp. G0162]
MRKQISILFFLKLLKIPVNLLLLSLTARYFGVSIEKDIWLLAFATITTLDLAIWGPINETFRTKFVFLKEKENAEYAINKTQSLLFYFICFSILGIVLIVLFNTFFAHIIAPDYNEAQLEILQKMLIYVAPALLFNQLMQIGISILNAYEIFFVAEISSFFSNILNIILLLLFVNQFGIYALAISYYISTLLLIFFILFYFYRKKIPLFNYRWNFKFDGFKMFFLFAIPFFLPYFFGQINTLLEKIFAAELGTGSVSILDFSNRVPMLLYSIVLSVVTTVVVPTLSKYYIRSERENFNSEFRKVFQLGILLIGLIIGFLVGAAPAVVDFLYDKGSISHEQLSAISEMTVLYAVALIGLFSYILFGMSLLASEKQKFYALMGMLTQVLVVLLNLFCRPILGIYTFPISIAIAHGVFAFLMSREYPFKKELRLELFKYILFILLLCLLMFCAGKYIGIGNSILKMACMGFLLCVFTLGLSVVLKIEEREVVFKAIKNKIKK